jgi:rhodanese-related sulfurtransferase
MGWDAHTMRAVPGIDVSVSRNGSDVAATLPLPAIVSPEVLEEWRRSDACRIIDVRPSMDFRRAHVPGSKWSIRPRIVEDVPTGANRIVLVSDDSRMVRMAARELSGREDLSLHCLDGGYRRWADEGRPSEASPDVPSDQDAIDYLFFVHDRHDGNLDAARQYLAWEQGLTAMLEYRERERFNP